MNFLDRIKSRTESPKDPLSELEKWIAGTTSRQSARSEWSWLPRYSKAFQAEIILFLGIFMQPWNVWEVVTRIRNSAYFYQYQEGWDQVQDLLEQDLNIQNIEEYFLKNRSEDDFFGSFLKEVERYLRREKSSWKPLVRDRRKPKRLQRHRGYRDKGSLRPYHQRGRVYGDSEGVDRREKVLYSHLPDL